MSDKEEKEYSPVAVNREARYNYEILERFEAGISLAGSEVKSIREGRANLRDAYIRFKGGEAFVVNLHISPYSHISFNAPEPDRIRKLLLKKVEIDRLSGELSRKGLTCVPLRLYFKRGWAKLEIAIAKGKKQFDRRESIKKRIHAREIDREVKSKMRKKSSGS
ncbi:MAG: SsrA-binding protein SmpB [Candidatus Omnitrophica bacterium]|nr:SsrA-binding protein SmpB [Candidatus Omnitrophota bacterium]